MLRPYSPEEGRVREMEIRAEVARAVRNRQDGGAPSRAYARPAVALAGALRRLADRLDARPAAPSAPPAHGVAAP